MSFKVGDKVRIHNCEGNPEYNGKIGVVIETNRIEEKGGVWDYACGFDDMNNYLFGSPEMEKVVTKGEQLLLFEL